MGGICRWYYVNMTRGYAFLVGILGWERSLKRYT
jgi:hypothetical protein